MAITNRVDRNIYLLRVRKTGSFFFDQQITKRMFKNGTKFKSVIERDFKCHSNRKTYAKKVDSTIRASVIFFIAARFWNAFSSVVWFAS